MLYHIIILYHIYVCSLNVHWVACLQGAQSGCTVLQFLLHVTKYAVGHRVLCPAACNSQEVFEMLDVDGGGELTREESSFGSCNPRLDSVKTGLFYIQYRVSVASTIVSIQCSGHAPGTGVCRRAPQSFQAR